MNDRQRQLIHVVMDMINETCAQMEADKFYAPPMWILENWWNTLQVVLRDMESA